MQILRQLPTTRARMVRGIVANEARDGSTPFARSNSPRPMDPVDGLLSRRCWFESNSGRHTNLTASRCESGAWHHIVDPHHTPVVE